jgi:hypothetical protein
LYSDGDKHTDSIIRVSIELGTLRSATVFSKHALSSLAWLKSGLKFRGSEYFGWFVKLRQRATAHAVGMQ